MKRCEELTRINACGRTVTTCGEKPSTLRAGLPVIYAQSFLLSSNGRKFLSSHAYAECRHAAQSFALPNFPGTQHHTFDSTGREHLPSVFAFWEEGLSEGF
jgi:hypothetical protein